MPTVAELTAKYFIPDGGVASLTPTSGNYIKPLIHGLNFFAEVEKEIQRLLNRTSSKRYFYMTAWHLGLVSGQELGIAASTPQGTPSGGLITGYTNWNSMPAFAPSGGKTLMEYLIEMHTNGIEVRILPWISPMVLEFGDAAKNAGGIWLFNLHSLVSANKLRQNTAEHVVALNTLAHTFGAMHAKMVICGDEEEEMQNKDLVEPYRNKPFMTAFVSGLDPVENRMLNIWRDIGARIEGVAAGPIYNTFRDWWNELMSPSRPNTPYSFVVTSQQAGEDKPSSQQIVVYTRTTQLQAPTIKNRTAPASLAGYAHHVQVLRTAPQMNFPSTAPTTTKLLPIQRSFLIGSGFYKRPPLSFAPSGLFEVKDALQKAILSANKFIYMEDQMFASADVFKWINQRIKQCIAQNINLKVIFLHGADPTDPPNGYLHEHIQHLVQGLSLAQIQQHISYAVFQGCVVHSKLMIVDDEWMLVGSANNARRSLYTDGEVSISFFDGDTAGLSPVQFTRAQLWSLYSDPMQPVNAMLDPTQVWGMWNISMDPTVLATWGIGVSRRADIHLMDLPFDYDWNPSYSQWQAPKPPYSLQDENAGNADSRLPY